MEKVKVSLEGTCADESKDLEAISQRLEKEWDEYQLKMTKENKKELEEAIEGQDMKQIVLEYLACLGVEEDTVSLDDIYLNGYNKTIRIYGNCNKDDLNLCFSMVLMDKSTKVDLEGPASGSEYNRRILRTNYVEIISFSCADDKINVSINTGDHFVDSPIIDDYERCDKGGSEFETKSYVRFYSKKKKIIEKSDLNLVFLSDLLAQRQVQKERIK